MRFTIFLAALAVGVGASQDKTCPLNKKQLSHFKAPEVTKYCSNILDIKPTTLTTIVTSSASAVTSTISQPYVVTTTLSSGPSGGAHGNGTTHHHTGAVTGSGSPSGTAASHAKRATSAPAVTPKPLRKFEPSVITEGCSCLSLRPSKVTTTATVLTASITVSFPRLRMDKRCELTCHFRSQLPHHVLRLSRSDFLMLLQVTARALAVAPPMSWSQLR